MNKNYYQILGVNRNASLKEIKQAYLKRCKQLHPDNQPLENAALAHTVMCLLNEAYTTLRDPEKRMIYDGTLDNGNTSKDSTPVKQDTEEKRDVDYSRYYYKYEEFNEYDLNSDEQDNFIKYNRGFIDEFCEYYYKLVKNSKEKDEWLDLYLKLFNFIDYELENYKNSITNKSKSKRTLNN